MLEKIKPPSKPLLIKDLGFIYATETSKRKEHYAIYKCSCGVEFKARITAVNCGNTNSCGCYIRKIRGKSNVTHGLSKHKLYYSWNGMIQRTTNEKYSYFKDYGGRGIKVCERWLNINNFIEDMISTYQDGLTIDRIDVNGNYEPSNCRWANATTQSCNTRLERINNTSGYRGVTWNKLRNKWMVQIGVKGKHKYLGYFIDKLEAAKAYDKYVIENNLEHTINGV